MDKNNPHNNLPQGIPPPLGSEQHAAEGADFSAIKQGFEANFDGLTPPKFLWDTIDQELKAELPTDAPEKFSSIKEGFESSFQTQSAPSFIWDALENENSVPSEEDYSIIKQSFEHQYGSIIVPLFSWDDLSQRMEQEALEGDHPDQYSRVREGYAAFYATHHPVNAVWQNILRQLHPRTAWWQANRQKIGSVLLVLGLISASMIGWNVLQLKETAPLATAEEMPKKQLRYQPEQYWMTLSNTPAVGSEMRHPWAEALGGIQYHSAVAQQEAPQNQTLAPTVIEVASATTDVTASSDIVAIPQELGTVQPASRHAVSMPISMADQDGQGDDMVTTNLDQVSTNYLALQAIGGETPRPTTTTVIPPSGVTRGTLLRALSSEHELLPRSETEEISLGLPSLELEWIDDVLDVSQVETVNELLPAQWQTQVVNPSIDFIEQNSFSTTRQALRGKRLRIELGVVGRLGTSMLLCPKHLRKDGSIRDFGPSTALGFTGQIYMGKNNAFTLSGYPFVVTWHGLQEGRGPAHPQHTDVEFAFMEVAMGYQRVLWHYSLIGEMPSRVYARLELGAAWVTRSNAQHNRGPRQQNAWYADLQYSTGLSFGTTHTIGNVVVDYGITGNLGLNSIVASSDHPSLPYPTRLFQVGGYLSLRYLLTPRLAPSKRMRQFDWSPPFYIEEPVY